VGKIKDKRPVGPTRPPLDRIWCPVASMNRWDRLYYRYIGQLLSLRRLLFFAVGCAVTFMAINVLDAWQEGQLPLRPAPQRFYQEFDESFTEPSEEWEQEVMVREVSELDNDDAPAITEPPNSKSGRTTTRSRTTRTAASTSNRQRTTKASSAKKKTSSTTEVKPKPKAMQLKRTTTPSTNTPPKKATPKRKRGGGAQAKGPKAPKPANLAAMVCSSRRPCRSSQVDCCHCEIHEGCANYEHIRFCISPEGKNLLVQAFNNEQ
jgi:hypothetical protein